MTVIYYSPHAQSVDNAAGRASGHADIPLSELGQQQARELGQHFAPLTLDKVYCSDLQRAHLTAQIIFAARGVPIIADARLREFNYGQRTQCPRAELGLEQHLIDPFPAGESILTAVHRVGDFLREVLREEDKTIVVIGHVATRYGLEYWLGKTLLSDIVHNPWEWRDIPIWRYEVSEPLRDPFY